MKVDEKWKSGKVERKKRDLPRVCRQHYQSYDETAGFLQFFNQPSYLREGAGNYRKTNHYPH